MKKMILLFLVVTMGFAFAACGEKAPSGDTTETDISSQTSETASNDAEASEEVSQEVGNDQESDIVPKIGFVVFDYSNAYVAYIRKGIENYCADGKAELDVVDSAGDQAKQNDQVITLIQKGVDVLIVNLVDPGAGQAILDIAKEADVPVCFINRAPNLDVLETWDKSWYVGISWDGPGLVQADGIKADWEANQSVMDKNGDGVLQYVLAQGNISQMDTIYRTKAVEDKFAEWEADGSLKNEQLDIQEASWSTTKAKELMDTWLVKYGNEIEAVVCNNDAMAMGVIQSLQGNGYYDDASKKVWVYGINALPQVMPLLDNDQLAGTVLTSPWTQAVAAIEICIDAANGRDPVENPELNFGGDSGRILNIEYEAISNDNRNVAEEAYNNCN